MKICARKKCGKEFEPNKPKQIFCSANCRVYSKRDELLPKKRGRPPKVVQNILDATKSNLEKKTFEQPQTNFTINTIIEPMPIRGKNEDAFDYAIRKNEWKKKYNQ